MCHHGEETFPTMMETCMRHSTAPPLTFPAWPGGGFPPVLLAGGNHDYVNSPTGAAAGAPPLRVIRHLDDVMQIAVSGNFPMANRRCPLTGAEMQRGLMALDGKPHRDIRRAVNSVFTHAAAVEFQPVIKTLAGDLLAALERKTSADLRAGYTHPLTAGTILHALGVGLGEWETCGPTAPTWHHLRTSFEVAFGLVQPEQTARVKESWDSLYSFYDAVITGEIPRTPTGVISQTIAAMAGARFGPETISETLAPISNGFGAILPILEVMLVWLLQHPKTLAALRHGDLSWDSVVDRLLAYRALFPVDLPRVATEDARVGKHNIRAGEQLLLSLAAAARHQRAPAGLVFSVGPHRCPGDYLAHVFLVTALSVFFAAFPHARLAGPPRWLPGALNPPHAINATLTR